MDILEGKNKNKGEMRNRLPAKMGLPCLTSRKSGVRVPHRPFCHFAPARALSNPLESQGILHFGLLTVATPCGVQRQCTAPDFAARRTSRSPFQNQRQSCEGSAPSRSLRCCRSNRKRHGSDIPPRVPSVDWLANCGTASATA